MSQRFSYYILVTYAVILTACIYYFFTQSIINHDVALNYYYSRCVVEGQKPYIDFIDMNAPMIWYLFIPAYCIEKLFSFPPELVIRLFVTAIAVVHILLSLRWYREESSFIDTVFIGLCLLTVIFMAFPYDFGQREHMIVVMTFPLLFALILKSPYKSSAFSLSLFYSSLSFILGIGIKPMYITLVIPLFADSYFRRKILKNCSFTYGFISGIVIISFIYLYHSIDYYNMLHFFSQTYFSYTINYLSLLDKKILIYLFISTGIYFTTKKQNQYYRENRLMLFMALFSLIAVILQRKGFAYHYIPTLSYTTLSLVFSLNIITTNTSAVKYRTYYFREMFLTIFLFFKIIRNEEALIDFGKSSKQSLSALHTVGLCKSLPSNSGIVHFSTQIDPLCYGILHNKAHINTTFSCMWFIPSFYKDELNSYYTDIRFHTILTMSLEEKRMFDSMVNNILQSKPAVIIVNNSDNLQFLNKKRFDFINYYNQDSSFRTFFSRYKRTSSQYAIDYYTYQQ